MQHQHEFTSGTSRAALNESDTKDPSSAGFPETDFRSSPRRRPFPIVIDSSPGRGSGGVFCSMFLSRINTPSRV